MWGVFPQGEHPIPCCGTHTGFVMLNLHKRGSTEYGFGYVGDQDIPMIKCQGPEAGCVPLPIVHALPAAAPQPALAAPEQIPQKEAIRSADENRKASRKSAFTPARRKA
jgi:hypothetical protein